MPFVLVAGQVIRSVISLAPKGTEEEQERECGQSETLPASERMLGPP